MEINIKMDDQNIPCVTGNFDDFKNDFEGFDPIKLLQGQKVVTVTKEGNSYTLLFENGFEIYFEQTR